MKFQITTLMENGSPKDCLASEHGLSLWIEGENFHLLYDTGASPRFLKNAQALNVQLQPIDALVLSHGHYDHTGGVTAVLTGPNRPGAIYLGKDFFGPRYSQKKGGPMEIGAAFTSYALEQSGIPSFEVGEKPLQLAPGLWLLSGFTATEELEGPIPTLLRDTNEGREPDRFQDEVAVVLEGDRELALVSGCSHVGILSMCRRVREIFGRPVTTFLGGTHLMAAGEERIRRTCACLKEWGVERLGACHCNGERAGAYFEANFPGFFQNHVGSCVTVE